MREIKFRAWMKNEGIMLSVYVFDQTGNAGRGTHFKTSKGHSGHGAQFVFNIDDAYLMQFTGLLDKNGKEIYEGDILSDRYQQKSKVYFGNGDKTHVGWCQEYIESSTKCFLDHADKREIIGNIYENPELFKGD